MTLALAPTLALLTVHPVLAAFGASHLGLIDLFVAIAACPACLAAGYRVEHAHGPGERPSFFATAVGLFLIMLNGAVVIAGWSLAALLSM
jgi:hypothetical protein